MKWLRLVFLVGVLLLVNSVPTLAAQSKSTNYELNEVQFGAGGLLNASSPNYKAQESVGSTGAGTANGSNYWISAGFLTPNEPFLSMIVNPVNLNLGTLSTSAASTGTATFSVRAYVDSGYVVLSENTPPEQEDGYALKNIATAAVSSPGTEQFGINLVQNLTSCSAPANFGANPVPQPNGSYATGEASSGYNTCGLFQYNQGDTIAQSTTNGWGETDYTISYLINVNSLTKAGTYTMTQNLVAVTTF